VEIIGGMFGLMTAITDGCSTAPSFLSEKNIFFANATSALALLMRYLQPQQVWLPSYLCAALPIAARKAESAIRFYPINYDLDWLSLAWLDDIRPGDVVVMIDYFGFPISSEHVGMVKTRGAWVIEDATQALLSDGAGECGDFAVFSPRKFVGVPDGGILVLNRPVDLTEMKLVPVPGRWWLNALNATILRRQFDVDGGSRHWFDLFREVESHALVGNFKMSELSQLLLTNCFDYDAIQRTRRANFDRLAANLPDIALFTARPPTAAPIAFPIRVRDRDRIRESLFAHHIYPPIHWALTGLVPEDFVESHRLSSEIMSLPCDHRYGEDDMERVIAAVREAIVGEH
jgi:dTDP-4-amino-4,6-dideoxygalactose transaminase